MGSDNTAGYITLVRCECEYCKLHFNDLGLVKTVFMVDSNNPGRLVCSGWFRSLQAAIEEFWQMERVGLRVLQGDWENVFESAKRLGLPDLRPRTYSWAQGMGLGAGSEKCRQYQKQIYVDSSTLEERHAAALWLDQYFKPKKELRGWDLLYIAKEYSDWFIAVRCARKRPHLE